MVIKVKNIPSNPLLSEVKICNQRKLEPFIIWFPNSDKSDFGVMVVILLVLMPMLALVVLVK